MFIIPNVLLFCLFYYSASFDISHMLVSQLLSQNKANCSLSAFDKENLIEFSLDLLHYIYNYYYGYTPYLPWSLCYSSTDFFATCCDCDLWLHVMWPNLWPLSYLCDSATIMWYLLMLHLSNKEEKRKEKEKKY